MRLFKNLLLVFILFLPAVTASSFAEENFVSGKDYLVITPNKSTPYLQDKEKNKVKVVEFFSYGCPACFKLEPHLEKWLKHKPHNVVFKRIPVMFQPSWVTYAKYYTALENLGLHDSTTHLHQAIFTAIQSQNLDLTPLNIMENFLAEHGIDKNAFLSAYHSPDLDINLAASKKIAADLTIFQVPAIIIEGKYKVDTSLSGANYEKLFATVNYLVHISHREKNK